MLGLAPADSGGSVAAVEGCGAGSQRDESFTTGCLPVTQFDSVRSRKCGFAGYRSPKIEGIVSFASSVPSPFGVIGLGTLR